MQHSSKLLSYFSFKRQYAIQRLFDWHKDEKWLKNFRANGGWHKWSALAAIVSLSILNISTANAQGITPIGGGGGGGSGTVTSIATTCGVAGGTITTTGTIRGAASDSPVAGTSYSIVDGDCGLIKRSTAAGLTTITAGSPAGFTNPTTWFTTIKSDGAAGVTLTPSGVTIDGSGSSITIATGKSLDLYSDGTNYHTLPGNSAGTGSVTTTGSPANGNLAAFSGATSITNGDLTGDCTTSGTLAVSCTTGQVPIYVSNRWYTQPGVTIAATGAAMAANRIMCRASVYTKQVTIKTLGMAIQTAGSTNMQLALYTNVSGRPGALLSNTGNIVNTATGAISGALGANQTVGPGSAAGSVIWHCSNSGDATIVPMADNGGAQYQGSIIGTATQANLFTNSAGGITGVSCSGANCNGGVSTLGTWPTLTGSTWTDEAPNSTGNRMPIQTYQVN